MSYRSRSKYCRKCTKFHDVAEWPADCMERQESKRSDLSAPTLIRDCMEPVKSMLDGKMYDSKSALRSTYKDAGVVEVGDDSSVMKPTAKLKQKPNRKEVKASVDKAFSQAGLGA